MKGCTAAAMGLVAALVMGSPVAAQPYPSQPIRLVVPFAAGGGSDVVARIVGEALGKRLGQPIIIENKPGAGAIIGADAVAKSAPDGYTLLYTTPGPQITNPHLFPKLPYDPISDFVPVAMLVKSVNVLVVHPAVPATSIRELIEHAKAMPGKLNFSSSGLGTSSHLAGELFKTMAGVDITHVPYRGNAPALQDLLAGNVHVAIDAVMALVPHVKSGGVRALGFATLERNPVLPEVPPIAETLPGYDASGINYVTARAGTPQPIIDRLNQEIGAVLEDPAVRERLVVLGIAPVIETPAQLATRITAEREKWKKVIEQAIPKEKAN